MGAAALLVNVDQVFRIAGFLHHDTHLDWSLYPAVYAKFLKTFSLLLFVFFFWGGGAGDEMAWGKTVIDKFFQVMNFP